MELEYRYRIVQKRDMYYPEVKIGWFWKRVIFSDRCGPSPPHISKLASPFVYIRTAANNIHEALAAIRNHINWSECPAHHIFDNSDIMFLLSEWKAKFTVREPDIEKLEDKSD